MKEGAEGEDMIHFLEILLKDTLALQDKQKIIRAHRAAQHADNRDRRARSIIVCFLDWDPSQQVLKSAWERGEIRFQSTRIYFDQDFITKTQQERN